MIAIFDQSTDSISETAQRKINLLGLLETFALHLALEDLLAACKVDQIEFASYWLPFAV